MNYKLALMKILDGFEKHEAGRCDFLVDMCDFSEEEKEVICEDFRKFKSYLKHSQMTIKCKKMF